jgi:catechol 2,3-dioxygenase-like lactoylglutathione lyase family enzyme
MTLQNFSHVGICVADLPLSLRFYSEGLGFREVHRLEQRGNPAGQLLELNALDLEAVYLEREGVRIELLHYREPGHRGSCEPRPMNGLGLTHLSLRTDDLAEDLERLRALGARVLEQTRIENAEQGVAALFVTDPDGLRIELVQMPGDPSQPPGA